MEERRANPREELNRNGTISFHGKKGSTNVNCVVKDISAAGARLIVFTASKLPAEFELIVKGLLRESCIVRWRGSGQVGVEFVSSSPRATLPQILTRIRASLFR